MKKNQTEKLDHKNEQIGGHDFLNDELYKYTAKNPFNFGSKDNVLEVKNLKISFKQKDSKLNKVVIRNVDISLKKGEVLGLIGESGSGKSVITTAMQGLLGTTAIIEEGSIFIGDKRVDNLTFRQWQKSKIRGRVISSVFQNPMTTLTPTMKIGKQIIESALVNKICKTKEEARKKAIDILTKFRMQNPELIMNMYPHELSGGMKQRCVIAATLIANPEILILDEPTTALDPTVQAEILSLVHTIQKEFKTSIIFITHDLGVISSIADKIAIMYAGKIVEYGKVREIIWNAKHPYAWGLLASMPDVNTGEELYNIPGAVPNNIGLIHGDAFVERNNYALEMDYIAHPPFFQVSDTHYVASWLYHPKSPAFKPPKIIQERWKVFAKTKGEKHE